MPTQAWAWHRGILKTKKPSQAGQGPAKVRGKGIALALLYNTKNISEYKPPNLIMTKPQLMLPIG